MSQTYQTRRREPPSAVPAAPSYGGFYARGDGEADGGAYAGLVPLSASAVPASAAGPMQAKKDITKAKEQAASEGQSIPSIFHPSQRAAAKDYYLSRWHAARLRDEFDSIDLGDTEESRRAGRQRQVEMLLDMQEVANDNSALGGRGPGSDFGNVGRVLSDIMNDLSSDQKNGPDNIIEVINAIQDARLAAAQQAKGKYENGEYGEQGTLDADAKERFLSRWNANQLKNEFNSIKLGSTEESRRAGRQRQVDMLMEMQEAVNDQSLGGGGDYDNVKMTLGNTLLHLGFVPYGKEHNSPEVNNVIEIMNAIQDARLAAAQEAKNKYESGEYGEQGSLEANARMANSPENRRFKNGALLLSQMGMGVTSDTDAFPVLQQLLEPGTPGAPAPTEAQSFLTAHTNERDLIRGLGEEQYGQFVDEGKKAASAKVAAWYRRKFGRVVRKEPRRH